MTPRFKIALAGLLAMVLATGVTWWFTREDQRPDTDLGTGPDDGTPTDRTVTTLQGTDAEPGTRPTDVQPGGAGSTDLVNAREPFGPDYSDPAFRAKKLAELLAEPAIKWRDVKRLLTIIQEPLSEDAKRILVDALRTGQRGLVVDTLSMANDPTLAENLIELVDDDGATESVRQAALLALGHMRGAEADEVSKLLESRLTGSFHRDVHLLGAIAERGGSEAARAIVQYLTQQSDARVNAHAFNRFDLGEDEEALDVFRAALLEDKGPVVTQQLLLLVAKPGSAALAGTIAKLESGDASMDVRKAALRALGRIGSTEAVKHLLARSRESGAMGEAALKSLDSLRAADLGAREALRKELERAGLAARPTETKARLLRALGRLKDKDSLPEMIEALDDPNQSVERAAIYAIGGLGRHAKPAFERMVQLYQGANTGTRNAVVHAMGSMGGKDALKQLETWSKEEDLDPMLVRMLRQAKLTVRHRLDAGKQ